MNKKYVVCLSEQERQTCTDVVKKLKGTSQKSAARSNSAGD